MGIIGLGQIAHGYDDPAGSTISTHIKACLVEPRLSIAWISDIDHERAIDVRERWNLEAEVVLTDDAIHRSVDIVCIATPDGTHVQWVDRFLASTPRLFLCEKPLASTVEEVRDLLNKVKAANCALMVNFMRRWIPGGAGWLSAAARGDFGLPVEARLVYCRGFRHNACHGLDLIGAAFGCDVMSVSKSADGFDDFGAADLTISAELYLQGHNGSIPVVITGVDGRLHSLFDVEIIFKTSRLRIWNESGIHVQVTGADSKILYDFHDSPVHHMQYVWKNVADVLLEGMRPLCSAAETLPGMTLIDSVNNSR